MKLNLIFSPVFTFRCKHIASSPTKFKFVEADESSAGRTIHQMSPYHCLC